MKHIIFLRHAKSDWDASYDGDPERPLAKRGRKAAKTMGRFLASTGLSPDLVLSSSAVRARRTAEIANKAGDWDAPIEVAGALYGSSVAEVLDVMSRVRAECRRIVVVGHEPTWSQCVGALTGGGDVRMPTAAMACLTAEVSRWDQIDTATCQLIWLVTPRLLADWAG